jgi:hypothetical protein
MDFYKKTRIAGRLLYGFAITIVVYCGLRMFGYFNHFFETSIENDSHFITAILTGLNVIILSLTLIEIVGGINYRRILYTEKKETEEKLDKFKNSLEETIKEKNEKKLIDWSNNLLQYIQDIDTCILNKKDRKYLIHKIDDSIDIFLKYMDKEMEYYAEYYVYNFPTLIENKDKSEKKRKYIKRKYKI